MRAQGDTIWIGTTRGLALWNGTALAGSIPDLGTVSPFGNDRINGIAFTGDTMFVATPVGVYWARKSERLRRWVRINLGVPSTPASPAHGSTAGTCSWSGQNPINPAQNIKSASSGSPGGGYGAWGLTPGHEPAVRRVRDDDGQIFARRRPRQHRAHLSPAHEQLRLTRPPTPRAADVATTRGEAAMAPDGTLFARSWASWSIGRPFWRRVRRAGGQPVRQPVLGARLDVRVLRRRRCLSRATASGRTAGSRGPPGSDRRSDPPSRSARWSIRSVTSGSACGRDRSPGSTRTSIRRSS